MAVTTDVQKLAKQAIYSLHRGQPEQAQGKIDTAGAMLPFCPLNSQHARHPPAQPCQTNPAAALPDVLFLSESLGACVPALHFGAPLCMVAEAHPCDAERTAKELLPLIEQHSSLRPGSYSASMEEVVQSAPCLSDKCVCTCSQSSSVLAQQLCLPLTVLHAFVACPEQSMCALHGNPALEEPCCAAAGRSPCLYGLPSAWEAGHH